MKKMNIRFADEIFKYIYLYEMFLPFGSELNWKLSPNVPLKQAIIGSGNGLAREGPQAII